MRRLSYPLYLLESVPPGRLAEATVRRLSRAFLSLLPAAAPASEEEVLAGFGAKSLEALPEAFGRALPGEWSFADPTRLQAAARAIRSSFPEEVEKAFEEAERLREGVVSIFGRELRVPREERGVEEAGVSWKAVAWERCPRTGVRAAAGSFPRGVDPKDAWALGRLDLTVRLSLASLLAQGGARSLAWADAALDWSLDFCQSPRGVHWLSPMEVALRAANLALSLRILSATTALERRPRALLLLLRALDAHTAFVASRLEDRLVVPNNHLLANLVGTMVVGALAPGLPASRKRAAIFASRFGGLVLEQTLEDGFSFEASTGYHRLAAELMALGLLAARALGEKLGAEAEERIRAVFRVSEMLRDGGGLAPQFGDEDSGQALPFRLLPARDHRHLGGIGRLLFSGPPAQPSWESFWLFGAHPTRSDPPAQEKDLALHHAGIFLQRSRRMSVAIACGPNGTGGTGSHAHNDKLSLEICLDGRRLVADPGSGRYTSDPALRNRLRGTSHHSTAMVDGEEQQELLPGRLFALPEQAEARCLLWEPRRESSRFIGEHQGYRRLPSPVTHRRETFLARDEERLFVMDTFLGAGSHSLEVRYLLPIPPEEVRLRSIRPREENELGRTMKWVAEVLREGRPVAILASALAPRLERGSYAEGYGQLAPATIVIFGAQGRLPMTLRSCVSPVIETKGGM